MRKVFINDNIKELHKKYTDEILLYFKYAFDDITLTDDGFIKVVLDGELNIFIFIDISPLAFNDTVYLYLRTLYNDNIDDIIGKDISKDIFYLVDLHERLKNLKYQAERYQIFLDTLFSYLHEDYSVLNDDRYIYIKNNKTSKVLSICLLLDTDNNPSYCKVGLNSADITKEIHITISENVIVEDIYKKYVKFFLD